MTLNAMQKRLEQAYPGAHVEVSDLTGTEDHYQVYIVSPAFVAMNRITAHKAVMDIFSAELKTGEVHALTIRTASK